jgi:tetratricopeptide (TPR) repeat protein
MERKAFQNPGRVIAIWSGACVALVVGLFGYDVALARYADHLRENDYRTYLGRAWEEVEAEDYVAAMQLAEEAKALAPEQPEPYSFAGSVHFRLKQWERALENMTRAIALGDPAPGSRMDAVWSAIQLQRYDEAIALGTEYVATLENKTPMLQYLAEAHLRADRPAAAIPYLEQCLQSTPDNLYQLNRLVTAYRATGKPDKAADIQVRINGILEAIGQLGTAK